ncbi:MAG: MoxR family ATPase [Rhodothermales bacterium]|nr:MoxR family ATPase [Rhodothermales bacterium]
MEPESTNLPNRTDLTGIVSAADRIREQIHRIIVGQNDMINLLLVALLSRGHVLIEGVPGVAKTMTAKLLARSLSMEFSRIQFTPDLMPSDIIGTSVFNVQRSEFEFKRGPIFSNVVLVDEINRAPAKTQAALFEVMEETQVTVDGSTYQLPPPFVVLATQNPIEHEGTYRLPEAQLDRFLMKIVVPYPTLEEETRLLEEYHARNDVNDPAIVEPVLPAAELLTLQNKTAAVHVDPPLMVYISQVVHGTRDHSALYVGGSPRASLAILTAAKAMAALSGRDFVTPEDIRDVADAVLGHRILLTPEAEMEGIRPKDVIKSVIEKIEVPR